MVIGTCSLVCQPTREHDKDFIDNQSSALDLVTCAKTSPFIGQSMSSSVVLSLCSTLMPESVDA